MFELKTRVVDTVFNLMSDKAIAGRPSWSTDFHQSLNRNTGLTYGSTIKRHIDLLDNTGIDVALLLSPQLGRQGDEGAWSLNPLYVIEAVNLHPDRFRGVVGIDPYSGRRGLHELRVLVENYGFVAAQAYPHWFGRAIDDSIWYPFAALCEELCIPLQTQAGRCLVYDTKRPRPNVGQPATIDRLACDFPDLAIVGTHTGWPWIEEMIAVADKHPNVYISIDAYAPKYLAPSLRHYINSWGVGKVMFGTDWPVIDPKRALREVRELGLSGDALEALLWRTAEKVYCV
jgi:predicted TIM-barrel fold metal-dependent hydrolase